jgi:hypothetical protein
MLLTKLLLRIAMTNVREFEQFHFLASEHGSEEVGTTSKMKQTRRTCVPDEETLMKMNTIQPTISNQIMRLTAL